MSDKPSETAGKGTVFVVPTPQQGDALPFRRARPAGTETLPLDRGAPVEPELPFQPQAPSVGRGTLPASETPETSTLPFTSTGGAEGVRSAAPAHAGFVPGAPWAEGTAPSVPVPVASRSTLALSQGRQSLVPVLHPDELAVVAFPWLLGGAPVLVVVAKATAEIRPGATAVLAAKAEPLSAEVVVTDAAGSAEHASIRYPTDFVVMKERTDVTVVGHAHPAGGVGEAALVRVRFGEAQPGRGFDRRIAVFGDRRWERSLLGAAPSAPAPFRRMPLVYERAFGGPGYAANPVGVGCGAAPEQLPNLENPERLIRSREDRPEPACMAPIRGAWLRRELASATELPASFDWRGFQQAPLGQQLAAVTGDEPFSCEAMHPAHPRLGGWLPGKRARVLAQKRGAMDELDMRIDTVHFDLDALRVTLVWRGRLPLADARASDVIRLIVSVESLAEAPRQP